MNLTQITISLILGVVDGAKRIIGEDAVKTANNIEGLRVMSTGEIIVTGNGMKILEQLWKAYEADLKGEIIPDIEVRLNVKKAGNSG